MEGGFACLPSKSLRRANTDTLRAQFLCLGQHLCFKGEGKRKKRESNSEKTQKNRLSLCVFNYRSPPNAEWKFILLQKSTWQLQLLRDRHKHKHINTGCQHSSDGGICLLLLFLLLTKEWEWGAKLHPIQNKRRAVQPLFPQGKIVLVYKTPEPGLSLADLTPTRDCPAHLCLTRPVVLESSEDTSFQIRVSFTKE